MTELRSTPPVVLAVAGGDVKARALDALQDGARAIIVDCTDAGYLDTTALGSLVSLQRKCDQLQVELFIANLNPELTALFQVAKLDTAFAIAPTVDLALEAATR